MWGPGGGGGVEFCERGLGSPGFDDGASLGVFLDVEAERVVKGEESRPCLCDRGNVPFEHGLCADMSHELVLDLDQGVDEVAPWLETDEDANDRL